MRHRHFFRCMGMGNHCQQRGVYPAAACDDSMIDAVQNGVDAALEIGHGQTRMGSVDRMALDITGNVGLQPIGGFNLTSLQCRPDLGGRNILLWQVKPDQAVVVRPCPLALPRQNSKSQHRMQFINAFPLRQATDTIVTKQEEQFSANWQGAPQCANRIDRVAGAVPFNLDAAYRHAGVTCYGKLQHSKTVGTVRKARIAF